MSYLRVVFQDDGDIHVDNNQKAKNQIDDNKTDSSIIIAAISR